MGENKKKLKVVLLIKKTNLVKSLIVWVSSSTYGVLISIFECFIDDKVHISVIIPAGPRPCKINYFNKSDGSRREVRCAQGGGGGEGGGSRDRWELVGL